MKFGDLFKSRRNIQVIVMIIFILLIAGGVWQYRNFVNDRLAQLEDDSQIDDYQDARFDDLVNFDTASVEDNNLDESIIDQPIKEVASTDSTSAKDLEQQKQENKKQENNKAEAGQNKTSVPAVSKDKLQTHKLETMVLPVFGTVYTDFSNSALAYSPTLDLWITHSGIDIKADEGSQVRAAMDGTVVKAEEDPQWGMTIVIDCGDGITTKYCNLSTINLVTVGQIIKKGDVISGVGKTALYEIADDPHLHFELLKDGKAINPKMYLPKQTFSGN